MVRLWFSMKISLTLCMCPNLDFLKNNPYYVATVARKSKWEFFSHTNLYPLTQPGGTTQHDQGVFLLPSRWNTHTERKIIVLCILSASSGCSCVSFLPISDANQDLQTPVVPQTNVSIWKFHHRTVPLLVQYNLTDSSTVLTSCSHKLCCCENHPQTWFATSSTKGTVVIEDYPRPKPTSSSSSSSSPTG